MKTIFICIADIKVEKAIIAWYLKIILKSIKFVTHITGDYSLVCSITLALETPNTPGKENQEKIEQKRPSLVLLDWLSGVLLTLCHDQFHKIAMVFNFTTMAKSLVKAFCSNLLHVTVIQWTKVSQEKKGGWMKGLPI